jgi:hypothetical protein
VCSSDLSKAGKAFRVRIIHITNTCHDTDPS